MRFSAKTLRLILIAFSGLIAIVFLAVLVMGQDKLSRRSQVLADKKLENLGLDVQLDSLQKAKKQVKQYSFFNDVARAVIPNDKDQAQAVLDIYQIATQSGLAISGITFPNSTLGIGSISATSPNASAAAVSQAKPVSGIKGLYSLELKIDHVLSQVPPDKSATYPKLIDFLSRLERNRRTAQITQVIISPQSPNSPTFNFTIIVNIFLRPEK